MSAGRAMPIVNLPPPSRDVRRSVIRLLIDLLARRALVELGVVAGVEEELRG